MNADKISISVIVPFYHGNRYINELIENVIELKLMTTLKYLIDIEIIIVNDSPEVSVEIKDVLRDKIRILTISNLRNRGIHFSRTHGLQYATGEWIIFLDQDDLLIPENYIHLFDKINQADIIVGNGYYNFNGTYKKIYINKKSMNYLINEKRFIGIRNMIPSPGECLIKKDSIPTYWKKNIMKINGADDWFLWVLMLNNKNKFMTTDIPIYIHRTTESGNLSFDYKKMYDSSLEMIALIGKNQNYPTKKKKILNRSINFKYLYDTKNLRIYDMFLYFDRLLSNIIYKITFTFLVKNKKI